MNTHPDFEELLRLLEDHRVDYMIVGGYAVAYHGYPRFTNDIDLFFDPADENAARLRNALMAFGFQKEDLPSEAFRMAGNILTFGVAPTRVDFINSIDGVTFEEARPNVVRGTYGSVEVSFIGFDDLIRNKKATRRPKDRGDVEELTQDEDAEDA